MRLDISYIIATYNRLPFLKVTLEKLISELQPGEEIVVVDGNSTDGSKQFLSGLFENRKIHQFISEPDKNQAHAWNKAMLMANGTIIKKILDDDVFSYQAIRKCKDYMLLNPEVDVLISNDLSASVNNYKTVEKLSRLTQFEKWKKGLMTSFTFGDVHMLIRKNSLSYIGLYNAAFIMIDWEYSLRISHLKANIAYYTGYNALSVAHLQTVSSLKNLQAIALQGKRGSIFYEYDGDSAEISLWSKIKIALGKLLTSANSNPDASVNLQTDDISTIYNFLYHYISELNNLEEYAFLPAH